MARLAADGDFRREVEAAERLGISHRRLSGWEPITRYAYDDSGRLIESAPEPEWTDFERSLMVALEVYRTETTCHLCGLPKSICRDSKNERAFDAGYERCFASASIMRLQREVTDGESGDKYPNSLAWDVGLKKPT